VRAFAAQAALALTQQRLTTAAEGDRVRSALLAAVSHDWRTPLAAAKAAVESLRSEDVAFDEKDRAELLATADESLDRLAALVANLLDMSRLQAGTLGTTITDGGLEEIVPGALDELGDAGLRVDVRLSEDLPAVRADPGLLLRCWSICSPHDHQYMARRRRKLEPDPTRPRHLLTEPGMGYRYQP
jgi:K+-sensing histidine kinase KdpD